MFSDVPAVSGGRRAGAIHIFVFTSHVPTAASSALCGAPGVASAIQAFIISSWLGAAAAAAAACRRRTRQEDEKRKRERKNFFESKNAAASFHH